MTIVVGVDGSSINDPVLEVGADLAAAYDDVLVAVHVVPEDEFEDHRREIEGLDPEADYSFTQEEQSAVKLIERIAEATLSEGDRDRLEAVGRVGSPAKEILTVATERNARYVVVGGRKRSPVGKALFGSRTQAILLDADRPVVAVMDTG